MVSLENEKKIFYFCWWFLVTLSFCFAFASCSYGTAIMVVDQKTGEKKVEYKGEGFGADIPSGVRDAANIALDQNRTKIVASTGPDGTMSSKFEGTATLGYGHKPCSRNGYRVPC